MRYNQFGRTGLFVSELALGSMTFGGDAERTRVIGGLRQEAVNALVRGALDAGINLFDTADSYAGGEAEILLGQAMQDLGVRRGDVVIASKFASVVGPGPNARGGSRAHIMDAIAGSLERLQTDYIDLYQIHAADPVTPPEEMLRALDDLIRQGMVRYTGVSNWHAWQLMQAMALSDQHGWARFQSMQAYYSIAGRDVEREIVPLLNAQQVALMVWGPLAGGLLSGKFGPGSEQPQNARRASFDFPPVDRELAWKCVAGMREIAAAHDVSVARVALAWLLGKPHVTTVIIGARNGGQLSDNIAATTLRLTAEEMVALDAVSALREEYPGWMWERQGALRRPLPFFQKAKR